MLMLAELVNRVKIISGQIIIPLKDLNLDWESLDEILKETVLEYESYKPLYKQEVMNLSPNPTYIPYALTVISIRPFVSGFYEHIKPLDFRDWNFYQKSLTTILRGSFMVEYLTSYRIANFSVNYEQLLVTSHEREFKFKLKGHSKKGTIKLTISHPTETYEIKENLASYKQYNINVININGNILTLESEDIDLEYVLTGTKILIDSDDELPSPLESDVSYFLIKTEVNNEYKIATTIKNAINGINITLDNEGSGNISIITETNYPNIIDLVGNCGYGTIDLDTLEVNLNLINSYSGSLYTEFTSLYSCIENLDLNSDRIFNDLFQANLLMSEGVIKEILKSPDLPFDFSADNLYNKGQELKEKTMTSLVNTGKWWKFRA